MQAPQFQDGTLSGWQLELSIGSIDSFVVPA
jgi:hypothetical protein